MPGSQFYSVAVEDAKEVRSKANRLVIMLSSGRDAIMSQGEAINYALDLAIAEVSKKGQ